MLDAGLGRELYQGSEIHVRKKRQKGETPNLGKRNLLFLEISSYVGIKRSGRVRNFVFGLRELRLIRRSTFESKPVGGPVDREYLTGNARIPPIDYRTSTLNCQQ